MSPDLHFRKKEGVSCKARRRGVCDNKSVNKKSKGVHMKKLLAVLAVLAVIGAGLYMVYQKSYGGDVYYVKITQDGTPRKSQDSEGRTYIDYDYELPAVNKRLDKKKIKFTADHNLRKEAFLALTVNKTKGVTSYQEVKQSEIKATILKEIN